MKRQIALCLAVMLCVPALAQAITITAGDWNLLPNMPGQQINILLSGAGGADFYAEGDTRMLIGGGTSGPRITHVFGDPSGFIPGANLAGSIWNSLGPGQGGIAGAPDATYPANSGRQTITGSATNGFANTTANGLYATLTLTTVDVAPGIYEFSLTSHSYGPTELFYSFLHDLDDPESLDLAPVEDLVLVNGTLTVTPEPASMVIGLFAVAAFAAIAIGRCARQAR